MAIYQLDGHAPVVPDSAFVAEEAVVIGQVTLGRDTSVWPGAVIRADNDTIVIGDRSNVQDNAVLHVDPGYPMRVGAGVIIGHLAMLHGCSIGDGALIGIGAIVFNSAVIGRESLVGAGSIVTEGKVFPERSLILGTPAKVLRALTDEEVAGLRAGTQSYVDRGARYRAGLKRVR